MKRSTNHLLAAVLAGLFGIFLTYGNLTSSDFFRGLYVPPNIDAGTGPWSDMAAVHPNRVWNYRKAWQYQGSSGMATYLGLLGQHGLKAILRDGDWAYGLTDSIPYLVEHYSCGQHKWLQAEMTYNEAADKFFNVDGTGFYHFKHYQGRLDQAAPVSWSLAPDLDSSGNAIYGPYRTIDGEYSGPLYEPSYYWPESYGYTTRSFEIRVRSKIDTAGYGVSTEDMAYQLIVTSHFQSGSVDSTLICRVGNYSDNDQFETHAIQVTVTPSGSNKFTYFRYRIRYEDRVPLWIDWIEYMDMEQAYPLFANETLKSQTLAQINGQCDCLEPALATAVAANR